MGIFLPFNYLAFGKFCQACHTVHSGSSAAQNTRMAVGFCIICHVVGTALVN
jgi:predicted CXXCH cytochrome family protein